MPRSSRHIPRLLATLSRLMGATPALFQDIALLKPRLGNRCLRQ